jgi:calcium channel MID1
MVLPFASSSHLEHDHNHHRIDHHVPSGQLLDTEYFEDILENQYQPEFPGLDRSLIGRAASDYTQLNNDQFTSATISAGQTQNYVFMNSSVFSPPPSQGTGLPPDWSGSSGISKRSLDSEVGTVQIELKKRDEDLEDESLLEKRQTVPSSQVYISASTCTQPGQGSEQLTLFVSTNSGNSKPGPGGPQDQQFSVPFVQGYAQMTVLATDSVYVGVAAPSGSGQWTYQVSASTDGFYLNTANRTYGYVLDTDSKSALLSTLNLTDSPDPAIQSQWTSLAKPPFNLFVFNSSISLDGITNSYCGISQAAAASSNITTQVTTRNNASPKQQFFVQGLKAGQSYSAFIGYQVPGQNTTTSAPLTGAGGTIWSQMNFTTKSGKLRLRTLKLN